MLRRTFLATIAALGLAATANAGTVYTYLVFDPATTAGAGVAPIAGGGTNMVVNSSKSGAGTFHLYAVDDADGSAGLRSFFVTITPGAGGTVSALLNRSPTGNWDDQPTYGDGTQSPIGFDFSRATTPQMSGVQSPGNNPQIGGFGITASNFQAKTNAGSYIAQPTSGQWGVYADAGYTGTSGTLANGHVRAALLLGEGQYTGAKPSIDIGTLFQNGGTGGSYFFSAGFPTSGSGTIGSGLAQGISNTNPFIPEPATLTLVGLAVLGFGGLAGRRRS
jgi:hypothetical protein